MEYGAGGGLVGGGTERGTGAGFPWAGVLAGQMSPQSQKHEVWFPLGLRRDRPCARRATISPQAPRAAWANRGQAGRSQRHCVSGTLCRGPQWQRRVGKAAFARQMRALPGPLGPVSASQLGTVSDPECRAVD